MAKNPPNLSVHREIETLKEAVALKAIRACAAWLDARGQHQLANQLLEDMINHTEKEAV